MRFFEKRKEIKAIVAQLKYEDKLNGVVFGQLYHEGEPVSYEEYAKILHGKGFRAKPLDQIKPDGLCDCMKEE